MWRQPDETDPEDDNDSVWITVLRISLPPRRERGKALDKRLDDKKVYRLYCEEGLAVRTKKRRKRASHLRLVLSGS